MTNKNVFLNWVSEKLIHINQVGENRQFASVSFPCDRSATGYASVAVNMAQLYPAARKGGAVAEGYKNVLLGRPDAVRQVSICVQAAKDETKAQYERMEMTNAEIAKYVAANRAAYNQAQASQQA